ALLHKKSQLPGSIKLAVTGSGLNLDRLLKQKDNNQVQAAETEQLPQEIASYLPNLDLEAEFDLADLTFQDLNYQTLQGELRTVGQEVVIDNLDLKTAASSLQVAGNVDYSKYLKSGEYQALDVALNVVSDVDLAELEQLLTSFTAQEYELAGELEGDLDTKFQLSDLLANNITELKLTGELDLTGYDLNFPFLAEEVAKLEGTVGLDDQQLRINNLSSKLTRSDLQGQIEVREWKNIITALLTNEKELNNQAEISSDLNSDLIKVSEIKQLVNNSKKKTVSTSQTQEHSQSSVLSSLPLKSEVSIDQLEYQNLVLKDLTTNLSRNGNLAQARDLNFVVAGGEVGGNLDLNLAQQTPHYQGDLNMSQLELNQIVSGLTDFDDYLYGALDLQADFQGAGLRLTQLLKDLTLQGDVSVSDGQLAMPTVNQKLSQWFDVFSDQPLEFSQLGGEVNLTPQRLQLADFSADTSQGRLDFSGYSTREGKLNYQLDYLLSQAVSDKIELPQKKAFYTADGERIKLDFILEGMTSDPEFKWDRSVLEEQIKKGVDGKEDEIKQELKEKLKKYF
ncbi:MAG: AsmA family protein, partial [Bacillota bacterium]